MAGMSRYYIARQGEFKHVLPTEDEIAKYGKQDTPSNYKGLDVQSLEEKAGRCMTVAEQEYPHASKEQKRALIRKMMGKGWAK